MSISLYFSNELSALLDQLADDLQKVKKPVFTPELIVTQTEGMQQWVSMEIARKTGVFANFEYKKPNDIVLEMAQMAKVTEHFKMSPDKIKWLLYFLLDEDEYVERFPAVSQYYTQGTRLKVQVPKAEDPKSKGSKGKVINEMQITLNFEPETNELPTTNEPQTNYESNDVKRMQLAIKIADLYDQMVIYRPAHIKAWNQDQLIDKEEPIEVWQAYLWQKMRTKLGKPLDRTQLKDALIQKLKEEDFQTLLQKHFPVISVFGISVLTNYHIEFFHELGKVVDVRFYFLNPAPEEYWYDYRSAKEIQKLRYRYKQIDPDSFLIGNDLLTSWGKLGQQLFSTLFEQEEFINGHATLESKIPSADTLLGLVQHEIYYNTAPEDLLKVSEELLSDQSIKIESCHSEAREVEVLYNYLVKTLSENPDMAPHQILVMVPNIETYSPYIQSIFDNAPYRLPYSLSDRDLQQSEDLVAVLFALLELTNYEFTSEKILQLLDYKLVTDQYKITNTQLIRKVVNETNIRFGWNNPTDATETHLVSWQAGLERIVLGIAMKGGHMYEFNNHDVLCYDALEGADAFEILRFVAFLRNIQQLVEDGSKPRTLLQWRMYIQQIAEHLLGSETENEGLDMVMNRLDYLLELTELANEIIPRGVFIQSIDSILKANASNKGFLKGNITFCSTLPMRSIPFKVVAIMGMNSKDFPRQDTLLGFDLMARKPTKGDRSSKLNDKYLFLEALLSSEKCFYLSYIGRSSKDNSHKEPSILIEELLNYIQQHSTVSVKEKLVVQHPLHGFSALYNTAEHPKLYTYFNYYSDTNQIQLLATKNSASKTEELLKLNHLIAAIVDPTKFYFNHALGIYYQDENLLVPESEIFELNKLDAWQYKSFLLQHEVDPKLIATRKQKGELPLANMGLVAIEAMQKKVAPFKNVFQELGKDFVETRLQGELKLNNSTLQYDLPVYLADNQTRIIEVCFSKKTVKYALGVWIKHLVLLASGVDLKSFLVYEINNDIKIIETTIKSKTEALEILNSLEIFYTEAQAKAKPVLHREFYELWNKRKPDEEDDVFLQNLKNKLNDENNPGLDFDPYLQALKKLNGLETELDIDIISDLEVLYNPLKTYFLTNVTSNE